MRPSLRPQKIHLPTLRIIGLSRLQKPGDSEAIGAQWEDYNARPPIAGAVPDVWYGVMRDGPAGAMEYLCGQEVPQGAPDGADTIEVPAGHYAQFRAAGQETSIGAMWGEVMGHWIHHPNWPLRPAPMIEVYSAEFNLAKGVDGFTIPIPIT